MKLKRLLKYVFLFIFMGFLFFLYGFTSARNMNKKVSQVEIKFEAGGHPFLTYKTVNKLLIQNKQTVKNQAKSMIDLYHLENGVLGNPYVEKASVSLSIDGRLQSVIKQRSPIVRIITDKESYYFDSKGVRVPLSDDYSARVPLVTGIENKIDLDNITALMQTIIADNFLQKEIVGIHKSDDDEYHFSVRSGSYKIEFGKLEEINTKFKKLKAFYNKAFVDKTIEEYKTINVKFHNQVVCTK